MRVSRFPTFWRKADPATGQPLFAFPMLSRPILPFPMRVSRFPTFSVVFRRFGERLILPPVNLFTPFPCFPDRSGRFPCVSVVFRRFPTFWRKADPARGQPAFSNAFPASIHSGRLFPTATFFFAPSRFSVAVCCRYNCLFPLTPLGMCVI
jgi:hypothetical protein